MVKNIPMEGVFKRRNGRIITIIIITAAATPQSHGMRVSSIPIIITFITAS